MHSPPSPPAMQEKIHYQFFWNTGGFPYNFFRYCETKNIRRKNVIPSFLSIIFSAYRNVSEKKETPYEHFRYCETKKFDKHLMHPCLLCKKSFRTRFFPKHRLVPLQVFSGLRDKKNRKTRDAPPPPMQEKFQNQNFFQTQKGSPTNFFGTLRQYISEEKPFLFISFFPTTTFLKQGGSLLRIFCYYETKESDRTVIPPHPSPHLLCTIYFPTRTFLDNISVPF